LVGFIVLLAVALWIAAFVDAITAPADRVRLLPKAIWVILILVFAVFAALAWFFLGRPRRDPEGAPGERRPGFGAFRGFGPADSDSRDPDSGRGGFGFGARSQHPSASGRPDDTATGGWQLGGTGGKRRAGPVAPDDDPEFLRSLGKPKPPRPDEPA
jgi:hypothetical protein